MSPLHALLLGVLQGLTEFFPISSSGHLVLAEYFLGLKIDPLSTQVFNVLLHAGTLAALLWCYWDRWWQLLTSLLTRDWAHRSLWILLILATIPGAIMGYLFDDLIAEQWSSPSSVAIAFLVTAAVLILGERSKHMKRVEHLRLQHALMIGLAQAFALMPGLSRSGLTISAGRIAGLTRMEAVDFSFLMAVPIIAGATLASLISLKLTSIVLPELSVTTIGMVSSFCSSALAIRFLRQLAGTRSLSIFAWYLVPVGLLLLIF